jgi:VanZ family protein
MITFLKYQKLTLLWALFVLVMCLAPLGNMESSSHLFFPGFDKLVHCGFFFVFTVLMTNGVIRQHEELNIWHNFGIVLTGVIFGGLIELLQLTVFTWRDGDWGDLFADTVGIGMAAFCILVIIAAIQNEKD